MEEDQTTSRTEEFDAAAIGALAHLYRGEVSRSTIWRTRLDNTTNWAGLTLGIAFSVTFSSHEASPLPLLLAGILCIVFLIFKSRRYLYFFGVRGLAGWSIRPLFLGERLKPDAGWSPILAQDYHKPRHQISLARAVGRRLCRNYIWILLIQTLAPDPVLTSSLSELVERAMIGPIPGN